MLLAIIVPSLKKAKGHARLLLDRNNLKALGAAMEIYPNESKDKFFAYPATGTKKYAVWLPKIGDQIGNMEEVRFCPETRVKKEEVERIMYCPPEVNGTSVKPWLWDASNDPG